jgi:phosphoribosylamine--glycine ligase
VAAVLAAAASGRLDRLGRADLPSFAGSAVCVVLAAPGYPAAPATGAVIDGLGDATAMAGIDVYASGVGVDEAGSLVTAGGRVLAVTARAAHLQAARTKAYQAAGRISWPGMLVRRDIAAGVPGPTTGGQR